jgi:hypothetical protein
MSKLEWSDVLRAFPMAGIWQAIPQFENLSPFRDEPGKVPLAVSLRNAVFDSVFYDTMSLSNEEKASLLARAFTYDEGGMLYVYPGKEHREIEYFDRSKALLDVHPELEVVTIAGVGSSVIGTAAFARQVSDAVGQPAVGIIAGYGAADVMSEALGGFFDFGRRNTLQAYLDKLETYQEGADPVNERSLAKKYDVLSVTYLADEPESNTLLNIMLRHADKLKFVIGHSKGALNIGNVLREFVKETKLDVSSYDQMAIVTLGCGVTLPVKFKNVHQYVGSWDVLGQFNTPLEIKRHSKHHHLQTVAHKGHNLVDTNPFHLPLDELLQRASEQDAPTPRQARIPGRLVRTATSRH